jgi:hypothetical protein
VSLISCYTPSVDASSARIDMASVLSSYESPNPTTPGEVLIVDWDGPDDEENPKK